MMNSESATMMKKEKSKTLQFLLRHRQLSPAAFFNKQNLLHKFQSTPRPGHCSNNGKMQTRTLLYG
jgi:hypothetical protein